MHASMFNLDLGVCATTRDRARRGRSLAAELAGLPGFIAFIAIEAEDGSATGLCICVDEEASEIARQQVENWHREEERHALPPPVHPHMEPGQALETHDSTLSVVLDTLAVGEVIVQRGF